MWRSSIPEKWVQLKGKRFFQKAAKEEKAKTQSFPSKMKKTRAILPIPDPLTADSTVISPRLPSAIIHFDPPSSLQASAKSLPTFHPYMREKTIKIEKTAFFHVFELEKCISGNTSSDIKILHAKPRPLIAVKRQNKAKKDNISSIYSFLHRFEATNSPIPLQPHSRRGVTGWKIRKLRLSVRIPGKSERIEVKTVRKQGEERRFMGHLGAKEPYLEYLRRKWSSQDEKW